MASRPIWRGQLRLALVSCPVALYSANHDRGSLKFNMINPETGNRIKMVTLDAETDPKRPGVTFLKQLDLWEVSPVNFPANRRAQLTSVKSINEAGELPTVRQFEDFLRDAGGFSKSLAAAIAAKATPHLRGEPEGQADDPWKRFFERIGA